MPSFRKRCSIYNPIYNPYRRFCIPWWFHWLNPLNYHKGLKTFWQRGTRGWADCDTWSFDHYLTEIIPPALRHLKDTLQSWPGEKITPEMWDDILLTIAKGFQAGGDLLTNEGAESFFGPGPREGQSLEEYLNEDSTFDKEGYNTWVAEKQATFDKGMELFHKHFFNLWN